MKPGRDAAVCVCVPVCLQGRRAEQSGVELPSGRNKRAPKYSSDSWPSTAHTNTPSYNHIYYMIHSQTVFMAT